MDNLDKHNYVKQLYSETIKVLYKYVEKVIKDYEYEGSPINSGYIDRETLNQMIDRVLEKGQELEEIDEIVLKESFKGLINEKMLLRGLIELIIVNELFILPSGETQMDLERDYTVDFEPNNEMGFYIKLFDDNINFDNVREEIKSEKITVVKEVEYFGNFL